MSKRKFIVASMLPEKKVKLKISDRSEAEAVQTNSVSFEESIKKLCDYFSHSTLPPIMLKHQLYSICSEENTMVDRKLSDLRKRGDVRLLRLGGEADALQAFVKGCDYSAAIKTYAAEQCPYVPEELIDKFLVFSLEECSDLSFSMSNSPFTDKQISLLVQLGVLTVRDIGTWWFAMPAAGLYVKALLRARKTILRAVRRSRYQELSEQELTSREYKPKLGLQVEYVLHDFLGSNVVERIVTTSSDIIRLKL